MSRSYGIGSPCEFNSRCLWPVGRTAFLRLSVVESLFRASEDALHKLKDLRRGQHGRSPQPTRLANSAAFSGALLGAGSAPSPRLAMAIGTFRQ